MSRSLACSAASASMSLRRFQIRDIGVAADGAGGRAGGIEQDGVEVLLRAGRSRRRPRRARPRDRAARNCREHAQPRLGAVDRGDRGAGKGELRRLAAGRRAKIGHALALHVAEEACGQGGRSVLHPPPALVETGQLLDAALGQEPHASRRQHAAREPLGPQLGIALDGEIERRLDEMGGGDALRARLAPIADPPRPEPVRRVDPRRIEARRRCACLRAATRRSTALTSLS